MPPTRLPSRSATSRVNNSRGALGFRPIPAPRLRKVLWPHPHPAGSPRHEFQVSSQPDECFFSPPLPVPFVCCTLCCRCDRKPLRKLVHLSPHLQIQRAGIHRDSHPGKLNHSYLRNPPIGRRRRLFSVRNWPGTPNQNLSTRL